MTNVFSDFNSTTEEDEINATINSLKTKYAKEDGTLDLDGLLKKAAHADKHIRTLESEAASRNSDEKVSRTLEEILAKIEAKSNTSGEQRQESETPVTSRTEPLDLDKLVEAKLNAYETKKAYERNIQHVTDELSKTWGPDYVTKLKAKARELGESEQFLNDLAATRPQTFLKLVVDKQQGVFDTFNPAPQGQRISNTGTKTGPKTYADFEKIRKENPTLYRSRQVQDQLLKLTAEYASQGKSFTET